MVLSCIRKLVEQVQVSKECFSSLASASVSIQVLTLNSCLDFSYLLDLEVKQALSSPRWFWSVFIMGVGGGEEASTAVGTRAMEYCCFVPDYGGGFWSFGLSALL